MDHEFWHQRWQNSQIGFHRQEVHPLLKRHISRLGLRPGDSVFVPLCGKSLDLVWLREQGLSVIGVEISPMAARALFEENNIRFVAQQERNFLVLETEGLRLYCGDLFSLAEKQLAGCRAAYDRAALIALPSGQRMRYAQRLMQLMAPESRILLITLEYPQAQMSGPPFSVGMDEVRNLFGERFAVTELETVDALSESQHLKEKGLSALTERAILLSGRT
jgi:thiopurine S-methyltransferase